MNKKYILSIDQGTTSSRAILIDKYGQIIEKSSREINLITPKSGWIEADSIEIWLSVVECINQVLIKSNTTFNDIDCIGITNQRESVVAFDKFTGEPLYNCIIWQSRQSHEICERFLDKEEFIFKKTGLKINPYFSASKMIFILEYLRNVKKLPESYIQNNVYIGTIDSWLIYRFTNKKEFKTDVSNASRTMLYNINTFDYDDELLNLFNIKRNMLPKVQDSCSLFGYSDFFNTKVKITSVIGDQQAALFGHACFNKGDFKCTYGTGCFMLLNIGKNIVFSKKGLLTSIGWKIKDEYCYVLEGSIFVGGAVIKWLRDNLKVIETASESENLANEIKDEQQVYFVPAFVGLGTPYWNDDVRGTIYNISQNTTYKNIVKAGLEAIAYQVKDVFNVMHKDAKIKTNILKADGGAAENNYLMQFQADLLNMKVEVDNNLEMTSTGAAYLAGLYSGFFKSLDEVKKLNEIKKEYYCKMDEEKREKLYDGWKKAIKNAINYSK